jgi:hypothetical protein
MAIKLTGPLSLGQDISQEIRGTQGAFGENLSLKVISEEAGLVAPHNMSEFYGLSAGAPQVLGIPSTAIAYYQFHNDLTDSVGSYDLEVEPGASITYPAGRYFSGLKITKQSGVNAGVKNDSLSSFTSASFWAYGNALPNDDQRCFGYNFRREAAGQPKISTNFGDIDLGSGALLPTGGWMHVAYTILGNTLTLYYNGTVYSTYTVPNGSQIVSNGYRIDLNDNDGRFIVDEISIYDYALTQEQVTELYQLRPSGPGELVSLEVSPGQNIDVYMDNKTDGGGWKLLLANGDTQFGHNSAFWDGTLGSNISYLYDGYSLNTSDAETMISSVPFSEMRVIYGDTHERSILVDGDFSTFAEKKAVQSPFTAIQGPTLTWNNVSDRDGYSYGDFLLGYKGGAAGYGDYNYFYIGATSYGHTGFGHWFDYETVRIDCGGSQGCTSTTQKYGTSVGWQGHRFSRGDLGSTIWIR